MSQKSCPYYFNKFSLMRIQTLKAIFSPFVKPRSKGSFRCFESRFAMMYSSLSYSTCKDVVWNKLRNLQFTTFLSVCTAKCSKKNNNQTICRSLTYRHRIGCLSRNVNIFVLYFSVTSTNSARIMTCASKFSNKTYLNSK